jgi:two-component system, response regulator PdtaR
MAAAPSILVVEDDWLVADHLRNAVVALRYRVCGIAGSADDAVRLARERAPDAVVMDVRLAGPRDGIDAAIEILADRPVPVIYVTGSNDPQTLRRIEEQKPAGILIKPIQREHLQAALARACPQ